MSITSVRILIVGSTDASNTDGTMKRLARLGWGSLCVAGAREAETVLKTVQFKVVMSAERLPDGSGYELAGIVSRQCGTLFIGVALSETCLWLPVVERGVRSLGRRALNPKMVESEIEALLRSTPIPATVFDMDAARTEAAGEFSKNSGAGISVESGNTLGDALRTAGRGSGSPPDREAVRGIPKTAIPPRKECGTGNALAMKRLHPVGLDGTKPLTGTHGKAWRG